MGKVIAFANQKGGVGKTTLMVNMATSLAERGYAVLVVDMDTQANATKYCGLEIDQIAYSIGHAMNDVLENGKLNFRDFRLYRHPRCPNLFVLGTFDEFHKIKNRLAAECTEGLGQRVLSKVLCQPVRDKFDYIFIDCAPSLDVDLVNALVAADEVMIITVAGTFSYDGTEKLLKSIRKVKAAFNPDLDIAGVIINCFDKRNNYSPEMEKLMRESWDGEDRVCKVYDTVVPRSIKVEESQCEQLPMIYYEPSNPVTLAIEKIVDEFLEEEERKNGSKKMQPNEPATMETSLKKVERSNLGNDFQN